MKSLVIAVATLALAGVALAEATSQTAPIADADPQVQEAVEAADQAAQAAGKAIEEAGAAAESAADAAADAAAKANDAAARVAEDAAETAAETDAGTDAGADAGATDAAAEAAAEAARKAEEAASIAADAVTDEAEATEPDAMDQAATDDMGAEAATDTNTDATTDATTDPASDAAAEDATTAATPPPPVVAPDVNAPAISEAEPGVLSSWVTSRNIWTTNQPSTTVWVSPTLEKRPGEWQNIAKVNDIVLDDSGEQVVGYIADIGGFLGIGAKKVLLGPDAIHLLTIGEETFFATNYTKEELEALPDFDEKTVRK